MLAVRVIFYIVHLGHLESEFQHGNIAEKQMPAALSTQLYFLGMTKSGDIVDYVKIPQRIK